MKKIIVGLVILLIVAGVGAPFATGLVMEKMVTRYQNDLNAMYADTGSGVTVDIMNYDRKFSSSEIEWRIQLGSLATLYGVDEIILIDRAKHGYTGIVTKTSLEKNTWFNEILANSLDGENPLNITTTYTIGGTIESIIDVHPFSVQVGKEVIDFRPGRIVTECKEGLTQLSSKATWEGLSVPGKVSLGGISLEYDLEKISTYIWDGNISYTMNSIMMKDQNKNIELINFKGKYTLDFDNTNNILSTGGEVQIDDLVADNERVKDTFVRLDVNNIDAQGYEEFMKLYTLSMHSVLDDINAAEKDPEKLEKVMEGQMAATSIQMMAAYEKLLRKGLEIKISDFHALLSAGEITGNLELILNQDVTFMQLAPIAMQPKLALDMFSLQSALRFPAELAGDTTKLTSPLFPGMQTGMFVKDGGNLVHRAETKNGKLVLNGSEVMFN